MDADRSQRISQALEQLQEDAAWLAFEVQQLLAATDRLVSLARDDAR